MYIYTRSTLSARPDCSNTMCREPVNRHTPSLAICQGVGSRERKSILRKKK